MSTITVVHDNHFENVLSCMNEDRKKDRFCDVKIQVGSDCLSAHKSVLSAESEYFSIMFSSRFIEASYDVIDLTPVFNNIDEVEQILSYLYTGSLVIDATHLMRVGRLASFFMIKHLKTAVEDHLKDFVDDQLCLKTWCLAKGGGYKYLEKLSFEVLKARFHDSIVFEEDTLEVNPDLMLDFYKHGLFQFCSRSIVLDFMVRWVSKNMAMEYVTVANTIVRKVLQSQNILSVSAIPKKQLKKLYDELIDKLSSQELQENDNGTVREFGDNMKKLLSSVLQGMSKFRATGKSKTETVLFTMSNVKVASPMGKEEGDDSTFGIYNPDWYVEYDLCVYHPTTKCWYYHCTLKLNDTDAATFKAFDDPPEFLVDGSTVYTFNFDGYELILCGHSKGKTILKVLSTNRNFLTGTKTNFSGSFITVLNETVYMVNRFSEDVEESDSDLDLDDENILPSEDITQKTYFTLNVLNGAGQFRHVCQSEVVKLSGEQSKRRQHVQLKINLQTKELLFIHSTLYGLGSPNSTIVYLVELNKREPTMQLLLHTTDPDKVLCDTDIVELENRFIIVREREGKVDVICQYVFGSKTLDFKTHFPADLDTGLGNSDTKFSKRLMVSGAKCLWKFDILPKQLSLLSQINFEKKKVSGVKHMAPPFAEVFGAYEVDRKSVV